MRLFGHERTANFEVMDVSTASSESAHKRRRSQRVVLRPAKQNGGQVLAASVWASYIFAGTLLKLAATDRWRGERNLQRSANHCASHGFAPAD